MCMVFSSFGPQCVWYLALFAPERLCFLTVVHCQTDNATQNILFLHSVPRKGIVFNNYIPTKGIVFSNSVLKKGINAGENGEGKMQDLPHDCMMHIDRRQYGLI